MTNYEKVIVLTLNSCLGRDMSITGGDTTYLPTYYWPTLELITAMTSLAM